MALLHFLLNHTVFGRALFIIGANPEAAAVAACRPAAT
jgi:ribose/xylose/arabinose/galactoside ABC-type transport system permease subunit